MLEQDPDDQHLTEAVAKETGYNINFRFFNDHIIFFKELSEAQELPKIIILNYNIIPGNVIQVLHLLKSNFRYLRIPVIVLSDSASPAEIQDTYLYGASSFITKPFTNNDTVNKISGFLNYWFNVVELPSNPII